METIHRRSEKEVSRSPQLFFCPRGVVSLWGNLALESRNFYVVQIQQGLAVWFKGRTSGVCQLWFIKTNIKNWPLLPGPTSSRAAYPLSAVARTQPSLPPAALTPCTLLLAAACTPTAQRLTRPKNSKIKKKCRQRAAIVSIQAQPSASIGP